MTLAPLDCDRPDASALIRSSTGLRRVCIFSHSGGLGGAERVLAETAEVLQEAGVECTVVLPSDGPLKDRLDELNICSIVVSFRWWVGTRNHLIRAARVWPLIAMGWKMARLEAVKNSSVVLSNSLASPVGALAAALAQRPHVWFVQELMDGTADLTFDLGAPLSQRIVAGLSDRIITVSHALEQKWSAIAPTRVDPVYVWTKVPNQPQPGEVRAQDHDTAGALRALVVGRIEPAKNQLEAVRSVQILHDKRVPVHLTLLGGVRDAEYFRTIQQVIQEENLGSRVVHVDYCPDPFEQMLQADVLVVCSKSEGLGRVAVEAMKLGKPVVGADIPATNETICDGVTGLLYELGNPFSLAAQLSRLAEDRTLIAQLGSAARRVASARWDKRAFGMQIIQSLGRAIGQYRKSIPKARHRLRKLAPALYPAYLRLRDAARRSIFTRIYQRNEWRSAESRSGPGSELGQTQAIRAALPELVSSLGVRSMLDIPCGDFYWMRHVDLSGVNYIGADIVPDLIGRCRAATSSPSCEFRVLDLVRDHLPQVDLIFCRDCMVHFSNRLVVEALKNIKSSGSRYLLATTFPEVEPNQDALTGYWRPVNLTTAPFCLPPPNLLIPDGSADGKALGLWDIRSIPDTFSGF